MISFRQCCRLAFAPAAFIFTWEIASQCATAAEQVHFSDFDSGEKVSDAWSNRKTEKVPNSARGLFQRRRQFLGEFSNDTVTLSLKEMPRHEYLRISFDLLILKNWTGLRPIIEDGLFNVNANCWGLQVDEGPLLLHAAFSNANANTMPRGVRQDQTYPCLLSRERIPARSRATDIDTLGYGVFGGDSVYKLKFVIPHRASEVKLHFFGENLSSADETSWGLDNVRVEVLSSPDVPKLDPGEFNAAWDDLAGADPIKAYDAAWKMIAAPDLTVERAGPYLELLGDAPNQKLLMQKVKPLVLQLDANEFRVRERATKRLFELGGPAVALLRRESRGAISAEARSRLEVLLAQMDDVDPLKLDHDARRRERLSVVLGIINTESTNKLMKKHYPEP